MLQLLGSGVFDALLFDVVLDLLDRVLLRLLDALLLRLGHANALATGHAAEFCTCGTNERPGSSAVHRA